MNTPAITIDQDVILVRPDAEHEYVLETSLVAQGYGVNPGTIRDHKRLHADELTEGKHFVTVEKPGDENIVAGQKHGNPTITLWTKRGIIRLGFFIRSERAKRFRDMAEDLIIGTARIHPIPSMPEEQLRMLKEIYGSQTSIMCHLTDVELRLQRLEKKKPRESAQVTQAEQEVSVSFPRSLLDGPVYRNEFIDVLRQGAEVQRAVILYSYLKKNMAI